MEITGVRWYYITGVEILQPPTLHLRHNRILLTFDRGEMFDTMPEGKKLPKATVLRKIFCTVGKKYATRNGGYTKIYRQVNRRGDNAEMALIQLT